MTMLPEHKERLAYLLENLNAFNGTVFMGICMRIIDTGCGLSKNNIPVQVDMMYVPPTGLFADIKNSLITDFAKIVKDTRPPGTNQCRFLKTPRLVWTGLTGFGGRKNQDETPNYDISCWFDAKWTYEQVEEEQEGKEIKTTPEQTGEADQRS